MQLSCTRIDNPHEIACGTSAALLPAVRRLAWIASAVASRGGASDLYFATSWFDGTEHTTRPHTRRTHSLREALVRDQASCDLDCAKETAWARNRAGLDTEELPIRSPLGSRWRPGNTRPRRAGS
jgi:hypothetical protein